MAETAARRRDLLRHRAGGRCEYCRVWDGADVVPFHVEHITPRQHGGPTTLDNLAWACNRCNAHKGPNLTGIDPASGTIVPLFNPRLQRWDDHFSLSPGGIVSGKTPVGIVTAGLLKMNDDLRLILRLASGL